MDDSYVRSAEDVCNSFKVNPDAGLSLEQVREQQAKFGKNGRYPSGISPLRVCFHCYHGLPWLPSLLSHTSYPDSIFYFPLFCFAELPEKESTPLWKLILAQFQDQLVLILLGAAAISFVLALLEPADSADSSTAFVEPIVILLILIANATVGVIQESNAEKAIDALKEYSPDEAKVLRAGHLTKINAKDLVPGDIIDVAVGDKIPADARIIRIHSSVFKADQAILTGESISVNKEIDPITDARAVKQDQINIIFSVLYLFLSREG